MGRRLKNHDLYMQKLEIYAAASGIAVEWAEEEHEGAWVPTRRLIRIDPHLIESTEVATFLHELGHSEDDSFANLKRWKRLDRAYSAFSRQTHSEAQYRAVMGCETRAWTIGRAIAKRLKIPLGRWFDAEEAASLADYRAKALKYRRKVH